MHLHDSFICFPGSSISLLLYNDTSCSDNLMDCLWRIYLSLHNVQNPSQRHSLLKKSCTHNCENSLVNVEE